MGGRVELWTDGACLGNPGPGGWAFVLVAKRDGVILRELEDSGGVVETTNNRMELAAVIEGLRRLTRPATVAVFSDSSYVVNAWTKGWLATWQRNGWQLGKSARPVKNADLWRDLIGVAEPHRVTWGRVKGHVGIALNERCDRLAVAAAERTRAADGLVGVLS
jgi:ribonuclease HI